MRRLVTGHDDEGRSVVVDDGVSPRTHSYTNFPGFVTGLAWATDPGRRASRTGEDDSEKVDSFVPAPGGTRLITMVVPPDAWMASPDFDGIAFVAEQMENGPGLAELFEPDGMHTTPTIDYTIVTEGEIWLELSDGSQTLLTAGDIVVQNATQHAWRNKSDNPAKLVSVLIGVDKE